MATYYVAITGDDTTGDGLTTGTAWRTIQKAVDTVTTGTPHTIRVTEGTYATDSGGYIIVNRAGLEIDVVAHDPAVLPVIATPSDTYCFRVSAFNYVVIDGLQFSPTGNASNGLVAYVTETDGTLTVQNCDFSASKAQGFNGIGSASATGRILHFLNNTFSAAMTSRGLIADDFSEVYIKGNTIRNGGSLPMIDLGGTGSNAELYYDVDDNDLYGTGTGGGVVCGEYFNYLKITRNRVTQNNASSGMGIHVGGDGAVPSGVLDVADVHGNTILFLNGGGHGILMGQGTSDGYVGHNLVSGADIQIVAKGEGTVVERNRAYGNNCIYSKGAARCKIMSNSAHPTGSGYAYRWSNNNGTDANPENNVVVNNIFDCSESSGACLYNDELTATNEGHFNQVIDYNAMVKGTGALMKVDGATFATLAAVQAKWAGSWTNGGVNYWKNNDVNSIVLAASPFANPADEDFRVRDIRLRNAGVGGSDIGSVPLRASSIRGIRSSSLR